MLKMNLKMYYIIWVLIFVCIILSVEGNTNYLGFYVHICYKNEVYAIPELKFNRTKSDSDILSEFLKTYVRPKSKISNERRPVFIISDDNDIDDLVGSNTNNKPVDESILKAIQTGIKISMDTFYQGADEEYPKYYESTTKFKDIPVDSITGFKFQAYAPMNFLYFRMLYNINKEFKESFNQSSLVEVKNTGKSKSKFFYTKDMRFIIKTVTKKEHEFLKYILQKYFVHFCTHPRSLLPNFAGLYYIQYGIVNYYLVAMPNIYPNGLKIELNNKYDLKGHMNAYAVPEFDKSIVTFRLLDNNFIEDYPGGLKIPENIHQILKTVLKDDCEFLKKLEIVDYSLILVTKVLDESIRDFKNLKKVLEKNVIALLAKHNQKKFLVYIGIVDILQTYNLMKRLESIYKRVISNSKNKTTIQTPANYAQRFFKFIFNFVFTKN